MKNILGEDYTMARAFPQFRQTFLNGIPLGEYAQYIKKIRYAAPDTPWARLMANDPNCGGMQCRGSLNILYAIFGLKGRKSTVFVDERPFLFLPNYYDFLGCLLHHEGDHARQIFESGRLNKSQNELWEALACANQFRNLDRAHCSREYQEAVSREFGTRMKYL